jgi:eukaryotic translation initiation factor 2-alpha kinase 4
MHQHFCSLHYSDEISCSFPKTYPQNAYPNFSVHQPIKGLKTDEISRLSHAIHAEVPQYVGDEMVFQVRVI